MFNASRPWHKFFYFALMGLGYNIGYLYNVAQSWFLAYFGAALATCGVIMIAGNEYGMSMEKKAKANAYSVLDRADEERTRQATARAAGTALPPIKTNGVLYASTTNAKVNPEIEMAKILNDMRKGGFEMDLSETYWIRKGHWRGTPESFRQTRAKWERFGIVGRRGTAANSPYNVLNVRAVGAIAHGVLKLPE